MTGGVHTSSSKIIKKIRSDKDIRFDINQYKKTTYGRYSDVKELNRESYPSKITRIPTESEYRIGTITRYFTQKANNLFDEIFEISKEDYDNQNNLFRYVEFSWRISGVKSEVIRDNTNTLNNLQQTRGNAGIIKKLNLNE